MNVSHLKDLGAPQIGRGATLSASSHILLDGVMHTDVLPLAPFSNTNPVHGLASIDAPHVLCAALGAAGTVVVLVRHLLEGRGAA